MSADQSGLGAVLDLSHRGGADLSVVAAPVAPGIDPDGIEVVDVPSPDSETRVFQNAARFRTRMIALALVVGLVGGYAVIGVVSVFTPASGPGAARVVVVQPLDGVVASSGAAAVVGHGCSQIQGSVFIDDSGDGIRSPGEEGLAGVGVSATDSEGQVVATATTAADGSYGLSLTRAMPVVIGLHLDMGEFLSRGVWPGPRLLGDTGGTQLVQSEPCQAFHGMRWMNAGGSLPVLTAPRTDLARAAAIDAAGSSGVQLHGRLWSDPNSDGVFVPGETALAGITVRLLEEDGSVTAVATTGDDGLYMFSNLESHHAYSVTVIGVGRELLGVNALGREVAGAQESSVSFWTGDGGLAVWGVDFYYSGDGWLR